ncbi:hypothetical protein [Ornithinimicrobium kibberense]|uniref:hypothetical protein n=1 Tax=Ornithinimicrobium kibberense TaxID=282060 RepID=UPI003619D510
MQAPSPPFEATLLGPPSGGPAMTLDSLRPGDPSSWLVHRLPSIPAGAFWGGSLAVCLGPRS